MAAAARGRCSDLDRTKRGDVQVVHNDDWAGNPGGALPGKAVSFFRIGEVFRTRGGTGAGF